MFSCMLFCPPEVKPAKIPETFEKLTNVLGSSPVTSAQITDTGSFVA